MPSAWFLGMRLGIRYEDDGRNLYVQLQFWEIHPAMQLKTL